MKKFPIGFSKVYARLVYRVSYRALRRHEQPPYEGLYSVLIADNARRSKYHRNDQFTGWVNSLRYADFLNRKYDISGELPF